MSIDACRKAFEEIAIPNFYCGEEEIQAAKEKFFLGTYKDSVIEKHWDTFQEGWEAALEHIKKQQNASYGVDMRYRR